MYKTLGYFGFMVSALASNNRSNKNGETKLYYSIRSIERSVCWVSRDKQFIEERLQQKFLKENISVKEVIYFSLANLKADIFYCVMLGWKARICFFHYEPMSYIW